MSKKFNNHKSLGKRGFLRGIFFAIISFLFFKKSKSEILVTEFEKRTGFRNYGVPSKFEKIFRWIVANANLKGNGVSYTPLSKLEGTIVPNGLHFERHHHGVPDINPNKFMFSIILKDVKFNFSLKDLKSMKLTTVKTFIECGGNSNVMYNKIPTQASADFIHGLFSISEWTGVSLKDIFHKKKADYGRKTWLEFTSYDQGSYNISMPFKQVVKNGILALFQNGEPIRPEQGYPLRVVIPGWEGSTHVKWLKQIKSRKGPAYTRNETSRYSDLLPSGKSRQYSFFMDTKSVILKPSPGFKLSRGKNIISGLAWSGKSKIKHVEVSLDGGKSWKKASLKKTNHRFTRFYYNFSWNFDELIIQSRCIDHKNYKQPRRSEFLKKMGNNSYYHYSAITSWKISSEGTVSHIYV